LCMAILVSAPLTPELRARQAAGMLRASQLDAVSALAEAKQKTGQLAMMLEECRRSKRRQLPKGTAFRWSDTPGAITLQEDVKLHAMFTTRRWNVHDPEMVDIDPIEWALHCGFTAAERHVMAVHGIEPYLDEAWLRLSAVMSYTPWQDSDDFSARGMSWLGRARDETLLYRGEVEWHQVSVEGRMEWRASAPAERTAPRRRKRRKKRRKDEL